MLDQRFVSGIGNIYASEILFASKINPFKKAKLLNKNECINIILKKIYTLTNGQIPIIGVGGISTGSECYEKIKSGASLTQLYTALIYSGPLLISQIKKELVDLNGFWIPITYRARLLLYSN